MESKVSSIVVKEVQPIRSTDKVISSGYIILFLMLFFLVLKSFIYITDKKRHGK
jgi:hypothetical protein